MGIGHTAGKPRDGVQNFDAAGQLCTKGPDRTSSHLETRKIHVTPGMIYDAFAGFDLQ